MLGTQKYLQKKPRSSKQNSELSLYENNPNPKADHLRMTTRSGRVVETPSYLKDSKKRNLTN